MGAGLNWFFGRVFAARRKAKRSRQEHRRCHDLKPWTHLLMVSSPLSPVNAFRRTGVDGLTTRPTSAPCLPDLGSHRNIPPACAVSGFATPFERRIGAGQSDGMDVEAISAEILRILLNLKQ
jgi:hypothetical protein